MTEADSYKTEDFRFSNTFETPIKLKLSKDGGNLVAEVYTTLNKTNVSVSVSRDEVIQPRTITRYSEDLAIGKTTQLQKGEEGLRVSVYRTVDGEQNLVSRDYYPPVNRVLLRSSRQPDSQSQPNTVTQNSDLAIDLDDDGFPDEEFVTDSTVDSEGDGLPPGSYYDKGGNIITPKKGED